MHTGTKILFYILIACWLVAWFRGAIALWKIQREEKPSQFNTKWKCFFFLLLLFFPGCIAIPLVSIPKSTEAFFTSFLPRQLHTYFHVSFPYAQIITAIPPNAFVGWAGVIIGDRLILGQTIAFSEYFYVLGLFLWLGAMFAVCQIAILKNMK